MSDYISRDAAKKILSSMLTDAAAECACNLIDCIFPADVEPVRHVHCKVLGIDEYYGEWLRCPNCGYGDNVVDATYCGGCGAKIDLEGETNDD